MRPRQPATSRLAAWRYPLCFFLACVGLWTAAATAVAGPSSSNAPTVQITQCPADGSSNQSQPTDSGCQQNSTSLQPATSSSSNKPASSQSSSPPSAPQGSEVHSYSLSTGKGSATSTSGARTADKAAVQVAPPPTPAATPAPAKPKPPAPTGGSSAAPALPHPQPVVTTTGGNPIAGFSGAYSSLSLMSSDQALSQFEIPPFLMPIYMAAARAYDVPWPVLASINKIETDFGRDLSVSSAGAEGWMQFMPAEWPTWAVDANGDGYADPYNPADAIFAAARYLHYAGASTNLSQAIFAYNHAQWYVDEVLHNASVYGSLPQGVVNETGSLAVGRFPLQGPASYGDVAASTLHRGASAPLEIQGRGGATAVATQQEKVTRILLDPGLAHELASRGSLSGTPAPATPPPGGLFDLARSAAPRAIELLQLLVPVPVPVPELAPSPSATPSVSSRASVDRAGGLPRGFGISQHRGITVVVSDAAGNQYSYGGLSVLSSSVRPGAMLAGGESIGNLPTGNSPALEFSITAAGGVPVDPRPLIDGYRLQEAIHFYHAVAPFGANPFVPATPSASYSGYVSPFAGYTPTSERIDMGVDYSATEHAGSPLVAIGPGRVIGISGDWYAGQPFLDYQITSGPLTGVYIYYAEQLVPTVSPGQTITTGQVIGRIASSGTGLELGFGTSVPGQTLAQVTGGYGEGALTAAGQAFSNLMLTLGAPGGLTEGRTQVMGNVSGALPSLSGIKTDPAPNVSAAPSTPATQQQEQAIAGALGQISNPKVAAPSPAALPVPKNSGLPGTGAASALTRVPSSAGADVSALAVPAGERGSSAWAVGTVDGTVHSGWAKAQTVVLGFNQGTWSIVGAPVDSDGHVVSPHLRAIAVTSDGSGYAVGDKGAVVAFGPGRTTQLLPAKTRSDLDAITVDGSSQNLHGVAVGSRGAAIELQGAAGKPLPPPAGRPDLTAAGIDGSGAIVAGNGSSGPVLYRDAGGSLSDVPLHLKLPAHAQPQINGLADSAGQLWLSGGLSDSSGVGGQTPLAARLTKSGWQTFCASGPRAAGAVELGTPTPSECDGSLSAGSAGAATAVASTGKDTFLATGQGLLVSSRGAAFRPGWSDVASQQSGVSALAMVGDGSGWALVGGKLVMLQRGSGRRAPNGAVRALSGRGPATVAAPLPSGTGAVITGASAATVLGTAAAQAIKPPGVPLRSLALPQASTGWGISETGGLVHYSAGSWSDAAGGALSSDLARRLGGGPLSSAQQPLADGLNAVSFGSPDDGYAAGGRGLILHYQDGGWHPEQSGTTETLSDVVDSTGGPVAVGSHGVLLERTGGHWAASSQAASLVGGHDFTEVASAADGSVVALAGGSMVLRKAGQSSWSPAPLPPLASPPSRLVTYRAASGVLHALVLVASSGGQALLDGDAGGWHPLAVPAGLDVSDVGVDPAGTTIWLAGQSTGHPAGAELPLSSVQVPASLAGQGDPAPAPPAPSNSTPPSDNHSGLAPLIRLMH